MTVSTPARKARCPWCRRGRRSLTAAGLMMQHLPYTRKFSGEYIPYCAGSGRAPREFFEQKRNVVSSASNQSGVDHG